MRVLYLVLLTISIVACDSTTPTPVAEEAVTKGSNLPQGFSDAQQTILAEKILADVRKVSGDEFEGRGSGTKGDRKAREFLAARLAQMGYKPLFENQSYEQLVEIISLNVQNPPNLEFIANDGSTNSYRFADDYMVMAGRQIEFDIIDLCRGA